jgi:hypothetical protein
VFGELGFLEEGIEDGAGDEVLGKHLDGFLARDGGVDVLVEADEEMVEGLGVVVLPSSRRAVMRSMWRRAMSATSLAHFSQ